MEAQNQDAGPVPNPDALCVNVMKTSDRKACPKGILRVPHKVIPGEEFS